MVARSRGAAGPGRGGRRSDPGRRARASRRRWARPARPSSAPGRSSVTGRAVRLRPAGDDRGDRRAGHRRSAVSGSRSRSTTSIRSRCAALADRGARAETRPHRRAGQRHLGRRTCSRAARPSGTPRSGSTTSTTGLRILRLGVETHLITSHHLLPLLIDAAGRPARRGDRRHHRVQRVPLPDLGVLRPGEGRGEPAGLLPGPRAGATRRHRGRGHPGLAALGDDAGATSASPRRTGATRSIDRADGYPTAPPGFASSESPRYVGRAVAALAADPDRARWNQQSVSSAQLAREIPLQPGLETDMAVRRGEIPPAREIPEPLLKTELPCLQRILEPHPEARHQRPALPGTVSRPELHREPPVRGTRRSGGSNTRHPSARHRTDQERANSTDKIPRRAALIVKRLSCLSSDTPEHGRGLTSLRRTTERSIATRRPAGHPAGRRPSTIVTYTGARPH